MLKSDVGFIYSPEIKHYNYGDFHPMKTERVSMTFDLLKGYDILPEFSIYVC